MTNALGIAANGMKAAATRFDDAANRIVRSGVRGAEQVQSAGNGPESAQGNRAAAPTASPSKTGLEILQQPFSDDLTSALVDLTQSELAFKANARVASKAYELSDALLDATKRR